MSPRNCRIARYQKRDGIRIEEILLGSLRVSYAIFLACQNGRPRNAVSLSAVVGLPAASIDGDEDATENRSD